MKTVRKLLIFTTLTAGFTLPAYGFAQSSRIISFAKDFGLFGATAFALSEIDNHLSLHEVLYKKIHSVEGDASPAVCDFVHTIMEREGLENPNEIKIYTYTPPVQHVAAAGKNGSKRIIFLNASFAMDIDTYLFNPSYYASQYKDATTAILVHEAAHLKYKHSEKSSLLLLFSGLFFSHFPTPAFSRLQTKLPKLTLLAKLLCAAVHAECWHLINKKYWRLLEFEADDAITRPDEIRADLENYQKHDDRPPKNRLELLKYTVESLHRTHPRYYELAERLESRLQEHEEN